MMSLPGREEITRGNFAGRAFLPLPLLLHEIFFVLSPFPSRQSKLDQGVENMEMPCPSVAVTPVFSLTPSFSPFSEESSLFPPFHQGKHIAE